MLSSIRVLFRLLTKAQRRKLLGLQVLVVLMAFAEVVGVMMIGPFMALVSNIDKLHESIFLSKIYVEIGFSSHIDFLIFSGVLVLVVLGISSAISIIAVWRLSAAAQYIGAELSSRLYRHYMRQPWLFHAGESSSQLTNKIAQECGRVTNQIITPMLNIFAKAVIVMAMAIAIFIFNPVIALVGVTIFSVAYVLLYKTVRQKLTNNGKVVSERQRQRFKLMSEGFGGIKDVLLLGRQQVFNEQFDRASTAFAKSQGLTTALAQVPKYAMELIAFGTIIFLILYLLVIHQGDMGEVLPTLSIYALAGFKMLPAFQAIYSGMATIKANVAALDNIKEDLLNDSSDSEIEVSAQRMKVNRSIVLENIFFKYPGKENSALNGLNIQVSARQVVGLVGHSGSGKSTTVDLLLGLIQPAAGRVLVDGVSLDNNNMRGWQDCVGYVPQSIFLADASIAQNIAFGLPAEEIDHSKVSWAARMAHLDEFVNKLPDGLNTSVGERGVQLSGGQRQRIGIARALYGDPDVLVLDEATSALDGITEKLIMDAINDFAGKKTIIMIAHRLTTVRQCNCIYLFDSGRIVDCGTYDELISKNQLFRSMAEH